MHNTEGAATRARWEVRWVKKGRVVVRKCGNDLSEALRIKDLAVQGGRKAVTLRCANMQFPPPDKYADTVTETVVIERGGKKYRGKKTTIIEPKQYIHKMGELNNKGIWWCPYCMKMRKFVKRRQASVGSITFDNERLVCPMCEISHSMVSKYNPMAVRLREATRRVSNPNKAEDRKKRRQRRKEEAEG